MLEENRNKPKVEEENKLDEKRRKRNKIIVISLFIALVLIIIICFVVILSLNGGNISPSDNCGSNGGTCPIGILLLNPFHL